MKILITGATGLIGTQLVSLLRSKNVDIHYLAHDKKDIKNKPGYRGFYWNPQQCTIDENCMVGVDAIIHLAGAPISKRWTQANKQEIIESRVLTANLLYKTLKNNPHQVTQFISASAIGIYPDSLTAEYTEDTKAVDDSFLGQVVVKWEASADLFRQLGIKVCKIRTGLVLAKQGGVLQELVKPIKIGLGSPYGSGKHWQSWIHIDDLVQLYVTAVEKEWEGTFNGTAPNPVTNEMLTKTIASKLHKPFFMPNVPKILMKWLLGEMHILLFTSQKVNSEKVEASGFAFKYRELDKALENILP